MALERAWYVSCDRCGNVAPVDCFSAANAREAARDAGFARRREIDLVEDLCPSCTGGNR